MSDTRIVMIFQMTTDGCNHVMTVRHHQLPLPRIGEYIYYGCQLEIKDIVHHYELDHNGHYYIHHTEMIVQ
jgi:hypothetical protein